MKREHGELLCHDFKKQITIGTMTVLFTYYDQCRAFLDELFVNWQNAYSRMPYVFHLKNFMELPTECWTGTRSLPGQLLHVQIEMIEALQTVGAWGLVSGMKDGLDSKLSNNASNLSGGQRQKILLARTLLKKADVYFFDEPTSALDREGETRIMELYLMVWYTVNVVIRGK